MSPVPSVAPATEPIDLSVISVLGSIGGEDVPSFLASTITTYLDHSAELLAQMQESIRTSDGEGASRAAHSLRGSSATLGARLLADICARVEESGLAGSVSEEDFVEIEQEFERVRQSLSEIRDAEGTGGAPS